MSQWRGGGGGTRTPRGGVPGSGTPGGGGGGVPGSGTPPGDTQVRYPPGGVYTRVRVPPGGGTRVRYPPGGGGVYPGQGTPRGVPGSGTPPTPPGGGGGYPGRTTEGVLTTRRAVCLLRSRRRTFLLTILCVDFTSLFSTLLHASPYSVFDFVHLSYITLKKQVFLW